jgi:hypothetical protein
MFRQGPGNNCAWSRRPVMQSPKILIRVILAAVGSGHHRQFIYKFRVCQELGILDPLTTQKHTI